MPTYMNEVFRPAENMEINTRNNFLKLNHPFRKTNTGQKGFWLFRRKFQTLLRKPEI